MLDFQRYKRGVGKRDALKFALLSSGFRSVILLRLQGFFYVHKFYVFAYLIQGLNISLHGLDVVPGCKIGPGLRIEHPVGIVIGEGVVVGKNCTILSGVTLGLSHVDESSNDELYPVVEDEVIIGTKVSILGGVTIGSNSTIGAHSVVLQSFLQGSRIAGIPGRRIN